MTNCNICNQAQCCCLSPQSITVVPNVIGPISVIVSPGGNGTQGLQGLTVGVGQGGAIGAQGVQGPSGSGAQGIQGLGGIQ